MCLKQVGDNPDVINAAKREMEKDSEEVVFCSGELKKKYASGKYDCYCHEDGKFYLKDMDAFDIKADDVLILKEHSRIAEAVILNPDIEMYQADRTTLVDFFDEYDETLDYRFDPDTIQKPFAVTEADSSSDGGSNTFYTFPSWVRDVDSLCRYWKLSSAEGNILKSLTAKLGSRHGGTDEKREVKKCLHYAVERMLWNEFSFDDIETQVKKHIKDKENVL